MSHHQKMPLSRVGLLLGFVTLIAGASLFAFRFSLAMGLAELQVTGRNRLDLYATSLEREIDKYAYFSTTLGLQRDVLHMLAVPDPTQTTQVNQYLEQLNERAGTLSIYVLNSKGIVLSTSNWRRPDSFVGEDLSFRPYFRQAMETGSGRIFGIGTTRGEPGYYLASSLTNDQGTMGVAVVKVGLQQLEKSWATAEAPVLVADENGVVILASVQDWKFTTLTPLDDATRSTFDRTQQYNRRFLNPLGLVELPAWFPCPSWGRRWSQCFPSLASFWPKPSRSPAPPGASRCFRCRSKCVAWPPIGPLWRARARPFFAFWH
jgi:two-component system C4-dicarboxylate transport sensor histidine kinase DctB